MGQSRLGRPVELYYDRLNYRAGWLFSMQLVRLYDASVYRSVNAPDGRAVQGDALASLILFSAILILTQSMIAGFASGNSRDQHSQVAGFAIEKLAVREGENIAGQAERAETRGLVEN